MPHTTYGMLKAERSHTVDSPSAAVSLETGRPNACNQCHLDQTLAWAAHHLSEWYELPKPDLPEAERSIAASVLWALRGDAVQRALIAWSMNWEPAREASGTDWMAPVLVPLLNDPYDAVRFIAFRALRRLEGYEGIEYDFLGPPLERREAMREVLRIWKHADGSGERRTGNQILVNPNGSLQRAVFTRLLKERDNRRVAIFE